MDLHNIHLSQLDVRPGDLDRNAHVNNARVLEYLEYGRCQWLAAHGLDRQARCIPVVARIEVDYHRELLSGRLDLHTLLREMPEYSYKAVLCQSIRYAGHHDTLVSAQVHIAFIERASRSLVSLADFLDECLHARELTPDARPT